MQIPADGGRPARRPSGALRASKIVPGDFVDSRSAEGASEGAQRPSLCLAKTMPPHGGVQIVCVRAQVCCSGVMSNSELC